MDNGISAFLFDNQAHGDDTYMIRELDSQSVLDVVLDGVSMGKGSVASQLTVEKLKKCHIKNKEDVIKCFVEANEELYDQTNGYSLTTLTACLKIGNQLTVINSGDSPAFLIRNNQMTELTVLDKIPGELVSLTNAVGIGPEFAYHLKQIQLKPEDKFILVTDGISDNVYPEELLDISKAKTPEKAITALQKLMSEKQNTNQGREDRFGRFKPDDMTGIVRYF